MMRESYALPSASSSKLVFVLADVLRRRPM